MEKTPVKVYFANGTFKTTVVTRDTTALELKEKLSKGKEEEGKSRLFEYFEDSKEEREIKDDVKVHEVCSAWEIEGLSSARLLYKVARPENIVIDMQISLKIDPYLTTKEILEELSKQIQQENFLSDYGMVLVPSQRSADETVRRTRRGSVLRKVAFSQEDYVAEETDQPIVLRRQLGSSLSLKKTKSPKTLVKVHLRGVKAASSSYLFEITSKMTIEDLTKMTIDKLTQHGNEMIREFRMSDDGSPAGANEFQVAIVVGLPTSDNGTEIENIAQSVPDPASLVLSHKNRFEEMMRQNRANWYKVIFRPVGCTSVGLEDKKDNAVNNPANAPVKSGFLEKQGHKRKNWKKRWFVLRGNLLYYYRTEDDVDPAGVFLLEEGCSISEMEGMKAPNCHCIQADPEKTSGSSGSQYLYISHKDSETMGEWVKAIRSALRPSTTEAKVTVEDFQFLKVLGKGATGKVVLTRHVNSGLCYAVKILKKEDIITHDRFAAIRTEWAILKKLNHPFLVRLHASFQTADRLYLVLDYIKGGELFFHLQREKRFTEPRARFYAAEIVLALQHLHRCGIVFRDLKPENILLQEDGHVVLTDFGLCKEKVFDNQCQTFCGTPEYLAPEVLIQESYGRSVDWWCLGITLFEMLTGRHPFYSADREDMYLRVLRDELIIPDYLSPNAASLLKGLLTRDPTERLGGSRGGAEEVKHHPWFQTVDFKKLLAKEVPPPFIPTVKSDTDVSNFSQEFTQENPRLTPGSGTELSRTAQDHFKGFSYTAETPL